MDPGFYEDLAGRLYGLLIGLEDRLFSEDASSVHQFIDARHYALALEEIARTVAHREIVITGQEHAGILALAERGRRAGPGEPGAAARRSRAGAGHAWITRITRISRGGCTGW